MRTYRNNCALPPVLSREDRYHATAVDTEDHFARCLVYIDLNIVRAGVVAHPPRWVEEAPGEIRQRESCWSEILVICNQA